MLGYIFENVESWKECEVAGVLEEIAACTGLCTNLNDVFCVLNI